MPSSKSKDEAECKLGTWLTLQRQNKYNVNPLARGIYYPSNEEIAISYGIDDLFEKINKESISNKNCHKVCQWILDNNKIPSSKHSNDIEIKQMGEWILSQKRSKNKLNNFYTSNQLIADSYGLHDLFDIKRPNQKTETE